MALQADVSTHYETFQCGNWPVSLACVNITCIKSLFDRQSQSVVRPTQGTGVNGPLEKLNSNLSEKLQILEPSVARAEGVSKSHNLH